MITGLTLKNSIISGANNLSNRRAKVDELNVFPVPDGDTGTNMGMTIGAARAELLNLPDDCTVEKAAQVTASAMLRGARGNSGVISSLLFRGFSKALAKEVGPSGVRVNCVCPGTVMTPLVKGLLADDPHYLDNDIKRYPLGYFGEPDDVAYGVLFLASDEGRFVTGTKLVIDGGYTAQ